jgi:protoporphyrinogen oxidase
MSDAVVILGAGMAGYGASHHLAAEGIRPVVYEKRSSFGGHTASYRTETGFTFDEGPHISFTRDEDFREILADCVDHEHEELKVEFNNYWKGRWIKHPVQTNLNGLPRDLIIEILKDYFEAYHSDADPAAMSTFADWLRASYGKTFAENFPMVYGKKYHTVDAEMMTTDWLGPRLYQPDPDEVLLGTLVKETPDVHYVQDSRYPSHGGFAAYLRRFAEWADLRTEHEVVAVDPSTGRIDFANGRQARAEKIVSSLPLPVLVPMIQGVPEEVVEAAARLACSTCVVVNIGVPREDLSPCHVNYYYDPDISFARVSYPHMLSPHNTPPGHGSIQAEVYFSEKYMPLTQAPGDLVPVVIRDLQRCGILRENDEIVESHALEIPYANIIFDRDRADAVATIHGYLDDVGIGYCGRYGEWDHLWTDQSFRSGERAAREALAGLGSAGGLTA